MSGSLPASSLLEPSTRLLPASLRRVRIAAAHSPLLEWAVGRDVSLPVWLLERAAGSADIAELDLRACRSVEMEGLAADLRLCAAFTDEPSHVRHLPFSYQLVSPGIRWYIARHMGRRLRVRQAEWAQYPGWPLDLTADFVADWLLPATVRPAVRPTPVLLTHDIDSHEGLRHLVKHFLPLEETFGARSTSYIVPCAWPLDHGLLREVASRGHEIGVHGFDHSNKTPFLPADVRRRRLAAAMAALEPYDPRGYRAPSLVRTAPLIQDVGDYFSYDSSIPTSGGPFPTFNNGCASARPFRIGTTIEIPISLRRDGTLLFLGHSPGEIAAMWTADANAIADARGIVVLLTHCERRFSGNAGMLSAYRRFVEFITGSSRFQWSTAGRVATETVSADWRPS